MNFNKEEFIEISWFGMSYKGETVEHSLSDLIIKTYNLQLEDNYLNISEQHNDTYIVCKIKNGIEGFDSEEAKDAFKGLTDNNDYIYEWHLEYILEDMIIRGVLERENYLVSYSW